MAAICARRASSHDGIGHQAEHSGGDVRALGSELAGDGGERLVARLRCLDLPDQVAGQRDVAWGEGAHHVQQRGLAIPSGERAGQAPRAFRIGRGQAGGDQRG